jgi:hypothetical protein
MKSSKGRHEKAQRQARKLKGANTDRKKSKGSKKRNKGRQEKAKRQARIGAKAGKINRRKGRLE